MAAIWEEREIGLKDISRLYQETAGEWLLLHVLETNDNGTPIKLRLIARDADKSRLHDLIMDDEHWDWQKKYLLVKADPNKPCTIG